MTAPTTAAGRARQEYIEYILKADPTGWPLSVHESNLDAIEAEAAAAERERIRAADPLYLDRARQGWVERTTTIHQAAEAADREAAEPAVQSPDDGASSHPSAAADPCTHDPQDCMCATPGHEACCRSRWVAYQAAEAADREAAERAADSAEPVRTAGSDTHPSAAADPLDPFAHRAGPGIICCQACWLMGFLDHEAAADFRAAYAAAKEADR